MAVLSIYRSSVSQAGLENIITLFFSYKNMLSRSEPREETEIATNKITTMFLNFGKSEPQRSYQKKAFSIFLVG